MTETLPIQEEESELQPEYHQLKRSKRHRRSRHKVSRRQAADAIKEFAVYARSINLMYKRKQEEWKKKHPQKYFQ